MPYLIPHQMSTQPQHLRMPVPTTSKTVAKPLSNQTIITIIIVIINFHHSFHIYLLTSYGKEELTFLVYLSMHVYHLSIYHLLIYLSIHHLSNYLSISIYLQHSVSCSVVSNSLRPCRLQPCQAPLSMGFPRQEYWSALLFSSLGDLSDSGIKPGSSALQADSLLSEPLGKPNLSIHSSNHLSIYPSV